MAVANQSRVRGRNKKKVNKIANSWALKMPQKYSFYTSQKGDICKDHWPMWKLGSTVISVLRTHTHTILCTNIDVLRLLWVCLIPRIPQGLWLRHPHCCCCLLVPGWWLAGGTARLLLTKFSEPGRKCWISVVLTVEELHAGRNYSLWQG